MNVGPCAFIWVPPVLFDVLFITKMMNLYGESSVNDFGNCLYNYLKNKGALVVVVAGGTLVNGRIRRNLPATSSTYV